jgi:hypothetical protein
MKATDPMFQRLLAAAAKAAPEAAPSPPFGLETRVLAHWRAAAPDDESAFLFAFFRRAMLCATFVFLCSAAWSLTRPAGDLSADEAMLANYDVQMSLNP